MPAGLGGAASLGRVLIQFVARTDEFDRNMARSSRGISEFAIGLAKMGTAFVAAGSTMRVFFDPLTMGFKKAFDEATKFQHKLNEITTIMESEGVSASKAFGDSIRQISRDFGFTLDDVGAALRESISSGLLETAKSADVAGVSIALLNSASKLARVSNEDLATSIDFLRKMLNGYGIKLTDTKQAQEELNKIISGGFEAVDFGTFEFGELNGAIGKVIPTAKLAGSSMGEMLTMLAALSRSGLNARESVVSLNRMYMTFLKPSGKALEVVDMLNEKFNLQGDAALELSGAYLAKHGIIEATRRFGEVTKGSIDSLVQLTGRERAFRGFAAVLTDGMKNVDQAFSAIGEQFKSPNGLNDELLVMMDTTTQMNRFWAQWQGILETTGSTTLPHMNKGFIFLNKNMEKFNKLIAQSPTIVGTFAIAAGGVGALGSALSKLLVTLGFLSFTILAFRPLFRSVFSALPKAAVSDLVKMSSTLQLVDKSMKGLLLTLSEMKKRRAIFSELVGPLVDFSPITATPKFADGGVASRIPKTFSTTVTALVRDMNSLVFQVNRFNGSVKFLSDTIVDLNRSTLIALSDKGGLSDLFRGLTNKERISAIRAVRSEIGTLSKELKGFSTSKGAAEIQKLVTEFSKLGPAGTEATTKIKMFSSELKPLLADTEKIGKALEVFAKNFKSLSAAERTSAAKVISLDIRELNRVLNAEGKSLPGFASVLSDVSDTLARYTTETGRAGEVTFKLTQSVNTLGDLLGNKAVKPVTKLNTLFTELVGNFKEGEVITGKMVGTITSVGNQFDKLSVTIKALRKEGLTGLAKDLEAARAAYKDLLKQVDAGSGKLGATVTKEAETSFRGLRSELKLTAEAMGRAIKETTVFGRLLARLGIDIKNLDKEQSFFKNLTAAIKSGLPSLKGMLNGVRALTKDFFLFGVAVESVIAVWKFGAGVVGFIKDIVGLDRSIGGLNETTDRAVEKFRALGGEFSRADEMALSAMQNEAAQAELMNAVIVVVERFEKVFLNLPATITFVFNQVLSILVDSIGGIVSLVELGVNQALRVLPGDLKAPDISGVFYDTASGIRERATKNFSVRLENTELGPLGEALQPTKKNNNQIIKQNLDKSLDIINKSGAQADKNLINTYFPNAKDLAEVRVILDKVNSLVTETGLSSSEAGQVLSLFGGDAEKAASAVKGMGDKSADFQVQLNGMSDELARTDGYLKGIGEESPANAKFLSAVNREVVRLAQSTKELNEADLATALEIKAQTGLPIALSALATQLQKDLSEPAGDAFIEGLKGKVLTAGEVIGAAYSELSKVTEETFEGVGDSYADSVSTQTRATVSALDETSVAANEAYAGILDNEKKLTATIAAERQTRTVAQQLGMEESLAFTRAINAEEAELQIKLTALMQQRERILSELRDSSTSSERREQLRAELQDVVLNLTTVRGEIRDTKSSFALLGSTSEQAMRQVKKTIKDSEGALGIFSEKAQAANEQVRKFGENAALNYEKLVKDLTAAQRVQVDEMLVLLDESGVDITKKIGTLQDEQLQALIAGLPVALEGTKEELLGLIEEQSKAAGAAGGDALAESMKASLKERFSGNSGKLMEYTDEIKAQFEDAGAKAGGSFSDKFKGETGPIFTWLQGRINSILFPLKAATYLTGVDATVSKLSDGAIQLPTFAAGSKSVKGGLSLVGEDGPELVGQRGPELVNLKKGSFVFNNKDTGALAQLAKAFGFQSFADGTDSIDKEAFDKYIAEARGGHMMGQRARRDAWFDVQAAANGLKGGATIPIIEARHALARSRAANGVGASKEEMERLTSLYAEALTNAKSIQDDYERMGGKGSAFNAARRVDEIPAGFYYRYLAPLEDDLSGNAYYDQFKKPPMTTTTYAGFQPEFRSYKGTIHAAPAPLVYNPRESDYTPPPIRVEGYDAPKVSMDYGPNRSGPLAEKKPTKVLTNKDQSIPSGGSFYERVGLAMGFKSKPTFDEGVAGAMGKAREDVLSEYREDIEQLKTKRFEILNKMKGGATTDEDGKSLKDAYLSTSKELKQYQYILNQIEGYPFQSRIPTAFEVRQALHGVKAGLPGGFGSLAAMIVETMAFGKPGGLQQKAKFYKKPKSQPLRRYGPSQVQGVEGYEKILESFATNRVQRGGGLSTSNPILSQLPPNAKQLADEGRLFLTSQGTGYWVDERGMRHPIFTRATPLEQLITDPRDAVGAAPQFGPRKFKPSQFRSTGAEFTSGKFNDRVLTVTGDPFALSQKYRGTSYQAASAFDKAIASYRTANTIAKKAGYMAGTLPYNTHDVRDNNGTVTSSTVTRKPDELTTKEVLAYHAAYNKYKQDIDYAMSFVSNTKKKQKQLRPGDPGYGRIPGLAEGGTVDEAGTVLVGEDGPELLELPKAAKVSPLRGGVVSVGGGKAGLPGVKFPPRPNTDINQLHTQIRSATLEKLRSFVLAVAGRIEGGSILGFKEWTRKDLADHVIDTIIPTALAQGWRIQGLFHAWRQTSLGISSNGPMSSPQPTQFGVTGGASTGGRGGTTPSFGSSSAGASGGSVGSSQFSPSPGFGGGGGGSIGLASPGTPGTGTSVAGGSDAGRLNIAKANIASMDMDSLSLFLKLMLGMGEAERVLGADDWNAATLAEHINTVIIPNSDLPASSIMSYVSRARVPIKEKRKIRSRPVYSGAIARSVSNGVALAGAAPGGRFTEGTTVAQDVEPVIAGAASGGAVQQNFNVGYVRTDQDLQRLAVESANKSARVLRRLG